MKPYCGKLLVVRLDPLSVHLHSSENKIAKAIEHLVGNGIEVSEFLSRIAPRKGRIEEMSELVSDIARHAAAGGHDAVAIIDHSSVPPSVLCSLAESVSRLPHSPPVSVLLNGRRRGVLRLPPRVRPYDLSEVSSGFGLSRCLRSQVLNGRRTARAPSKPANI